ncbi:hypothetical protein [Pelolinea submarina]|uniref:Uncharacterized protein n=1 Tax=Pelolinea submarina TaxID=913107 RepID=A0A3E0AFT8_9CHLR|nr:hypothetical protein [Pelolinea submarina]REG10521.1 hypothetical protein DFR64_0380 [Pelolinea submarina]
MNKRALGIIGGIISLIIGGTVYNISQEDVANKFSEETGMSQKEAEQYVENIPDDELVSFDELGSDLIEDGQDILSLSSEVDCVTYYYEWETESLTCTEGKSQFRKFGDSEIALGKAYKELSSESASTEDIYSAIRLIDEVNENYDLEIIKKLMDNSDIDEAVKTNLYNKALLRAVLESD